ncbi:MAG: hypothetical protein IKG39_07375 [Lachnospiraceae bacterium]|nr:hypothetical protein [Lachnospiraceae bacterium]
MKDYHEYKKKDIGASDIAALVVVGWTQEGVNAKMLNFGEDGSYSAYIVDEAAEIPESYELVMEFESWVKIYDDSDLMFAASGRNIRIFRRGMQGCIIRIVK